MKSFTIWQDSQQLKAPAQRVQKRNSSIGAKLNNIWQTVIAYLATTSEPHVWTSQRSAGGGSGDVPVQAEDATGYTQWNAYDPLTRQFAHFASAQEMRVWLEERHYQYHLAAQ